MRSDRLSSRTNSSLTELTRAISEQKDDSARALKRRNDEVRYIHCSRFGRAIRGQADAKENLNPMVETADRV